MKITNRVDKDIIQYKDTLNFYYLIGIIVTDGCVQSKQLGSTNNAVVISQSIIHLELLEKLYKEFGGVIYKYKTDKKSFNPNTEYLHYRISDNFLVNYLVNEVGLQKAKTYNVNIVSWFNKLCDLEKMSFIRGCYDGDGCVKIYNNKGKSKKPYTSICSASYDFIILIANYFNRDGVLHTSTKNPKATCPLYYWYMTGQKAKNLIQVYENGNVLYMNKKKASIENIKKYYEKHVPLKKSSIYCGVKKNNKCKKRPWVAISTNNGVKYCLGSYKHEKNAAIAFDIMKTIAINNRLPYNFPEKIQEYKKIDVELDKKTSFEDFPKYVRMLDFAIDEEIIDRKYRGIYKIKNTDRWKATVYIKASQQTVPGSFDSPELAAKAYDVLAKQLKGDKARLNFE